ncbi:MAG: glutamate--tRNA ligase [Alphaproteobacteria bacterium]|nr:glutamate--tRNA ligase [Alphaproteobacteria bacterium]
MTVRTRFAPSPTGRLHLGNVRAALLNWLYARKTGGKFLLRLDDTDLERSRPEYADGIVADMKWLGLHWDEFARQSDRLARYDAAAEKLKSLGRLYACYETPEELKLKRFSQVSEGGVQVYDRAALRLTDAQKQAYEAEGRKPHWRFLLDAKDVRWNDLIRGECSYHGSRVSDPVLIREDGSPTYTLASVVDDVELDVTHIVRGEDHVTNTSVQIQIFEALGRDPTTIHFAHFTLIGDIGGHNLSKREGGLSVANLRDDGLEPEAIASLLARFGTSDSVEPVASLDALVPGFAFEKFSRASPKLDPEDLLRLNAKIVHGLSFDEAKARLPEGADATFWDGVRPNLTKVLDAREWWALTHQPVAPVLGDPAFLAEAAKLLPAEPWDATTWGAWTKALGAATGRKGKDLFMPLRLALTAREHGPELKSLLPMLGRARALARLEGKAA